MSLIVRRGFLLIALLVGLSPSSVFAQSVELTAPLVSSNIGEAEDYASVVLNNPWDFNEQRDIGWEENFLGSTIVSEGGIWKATLKDPGAYVFPLFPGFPGSLFPEPLGGDRSLPKLGINYPIDTAKYSLLSFKMKHSRRSSLAVMWGVDTGTQYWPDGSQLGASFDGYYTSSAGFSHPNDSWVIYSYDMKNLKSSFDQAKGSWSGQVVSLRLDPSLSSLAGSAVEFDWVRLVNPQTSPNITVNWKSRSLPSQKIIKVFIDTNNSGFDGAPIETISDYSDPGTFTFNSGILPAGTYYFYVQVLHGSGFTQSIRSAYSAPVVVKAAPNGYFTSPTTISGKDYATTELGNSWDMADGSDVANLPGSSWNDDWRQFTSQSFSNGVFQAVASLPLAGRTETDAQVHLNVSSSKKIDPGKYRYLTYRIAADSSQYSNLHEMVEKGFVARPVYWDLALFGDGGHTKAHVLYEGYHTYTIDLWDSSIIEAGRKWLDSLDIGNLRIDPLETSIYNWFFMDWVTLTTENYAENNSYEISWVIEDSDSQSFSTALYYDDNQSGFDGVKIVQLDGLKSGAKSYKWDTSGLESGRTLYTYAVISDGTSTRAFYAPAPIKTGTYERSAAPRDVPYDYDGDFKSDQIVYRQDAGGVFFARQSTVGPIVTAWGGSNFKPIHGDFDGDGKSDYAVVIPSGLYLQWYVYRSTDQGLLFSTWGLADDVVAVGDYNGDGKDDIAVWRPSDGTWYILYQDGTAKVQQWGLPGDVPVPGDYDGDGKTDTAIWRPSTGTWWVLNSSKAIGATGYYTAAQWGLPGDIPLVGDFDNDSKDDFTVFRPAYGMWFVKGSVSGLIEIAQWGLPGDLPIVGDFDGDGRMDFTVYRPAVGMWFENFRRNGEYAAVQWGLPTDILP